MKHPIAIFADLHLHEHAAFASEREGYNSRLMDSRDVVMQIAKKAHERGVRVMVFAGDWNHSRRKISVACIDVSEEVIRRVQRDYSISIVAIPGNHDLSLDGKSCSIGGLPFSRVITKPGVYEIDGCMIGMIPWTDDPKDVSAVLKQHADIYVGHFGVAGARVGPSDFEMPGHIGVDVISRRMNHAPLFLGHYHKPQNIVDKNTMYVGSPLQLGWGETGEDKRFVVVSKNNRTGDIAIESVSLDGPRFVRVKPSELESCRQEDFVEVVVDNAKHVKRVRNKIELTRGDRGANIVLMTEASSEKAMLELSGLNIREQLTKFVKHVGPPPGIERAELIKIGTQLVEQTA